MGQISMEIIRLPGSLLSGNQQFAFAFNPVFLSSVTLVLAAIGFHSLKGRLVKAD